MSIQYDSYHTRWDSEGYDVFDEIGRDALVMDRVKRKGENALKGSRRYVGENKHQTIHLLDSVLIIIEIPLSPSRIFRGLSLSLLCFDF